ncbi:AAA ATPase central domain protein [Nostocoides japonicum T1-X7]|uniref:AAA ATPase central domain protein n=1 Tax=Nostocoides japonicum T1-X7 TaxID=1194083 RepID=A0A077LYB5_9MICO|nr:ATP-binding protein [Tetrasphaera japonica]CCH76940.1 AAA ATPase central domain protein [Tetrasphaera japonica T1-X7]
MTDEGEGDDVRAFMGSFSGLVRRMLQELDEGREGEGLAGVLSAHLGAAADELAVVTEAVPGHRVVDADLALAELTAADPAARVIGIGGGDARHHMTLADLLHAGWGRHTGMPVGQVDYLRMDTGPGPADSRDVVTSGIWLFRYAGHPVAVRVWGVNPQFGREDASLEILAEDPGTSRALVDRLGALMDERSIIRGQVVTFAPDPFGRGLGGMTFVARPTLAAEDVILPDGRLERIEAHVLGIGRHAAALRRGGQHLKRGVLLYGPPGTGKTHTVRYLVSRCPGTTVVLLAGGALAHVHSAAKVARAHQPALVVLEDCDLVAEDRDMSMGPSPLLFEVMDALDGLDPDADIAFLLTTNRVEALEGALAQRPGRVDLAAEIPLPDGSGRLALLRLYAGGHFSESALREAAERAEGTTASFAKELVRRAVLRATLASTPVGDEDLSAALDELLDDAETMTRSLLGVVGPDAPGPAGPHPVGVRARPGLAPRGVVGRGWTMYGPGAP